MVDEVLTNWLGVMEAKNEDGLVGTAGAVIDQDLDERVHAVDAQRAQGLSVAAACRAAGVSTSTYYRLRRGAALGALALPAPAPDWPFEPTTPKAPLYWDQAFADELTDSFVRREFGAGDLRTRAGRALSSLTQRGAPHRLQRFMRRLSNGPLGAAGPPLAGFVLFMLLIATAGWMVSMAAEPAAWLRDPQTLQTLAAGAR